MMDAYNDPDIEDVTFEASAQVGKTQGGLNNILGYTIAQNPGPVMVVQPTQQDAKEWSKDRFMDGLIAVTPCLKGKIKDVRTKGSKDTIEHKRFPGGQLTVAWSKSPSRLASRPIRDVFFDEVDKYDIKPGVQGNAVDRGKARTKTFFNRKHFHFSTPTLGSLKAEAGEGELSLVDRLYRQSDMRRFHVPCPGCGAAGVIAFWADMEHPAVRGAQFHVEWDKAEDGTPLPGDRTSRLPQLRSDHLRGGTSDDDSRWRMEGISSGREPCRVSHQRAVLHAGRELACAHGGPVPQGTEGS